MTTKTKNPAAVGTPAVGSTGGATQGVSAAGALLIYSLHGATAP